MSSKRINKIQLTQIYYHKYPIIQVLPLDFGNQTVILSLDKYNLVLFEQPHGDEEYKCSCTYSIRREIEGDF